MNSLPPELDPLLETRLTELVGYLNFSAGNSDARFLENLNEVFRHAASLHEPGAPTQQALLGWIDAMADRLHASGGAFENIDQYRGVMRALRERFLADYRQFHRDLLWHRGDHELWRPFMLGRVFETLLQQGPPWDDLDRLVADARDQLDDYIGYRPVAVLESQKLEPYRHEWVRPIPLYIEGAGVATGKYEQVISRTLEILRSTSPDLLADAWFDPALLQELALDPRAYDFDHPVNKRPNYHFGQWDPNHIDNKGFYRRFVLQPLTLDSLLSRVEEADQWGRPREELLFEASAVLAGTILMASGTSGNGPNCHGSDVTLSTLLPHIAAYRDRFYEALLQQAEGPLGERLRDEAQRSRQPFGGARQHLNQELARRRAIQLQTVHLAQVYARMGYPEASLAKAKSVRVASARMLCQIYCRLTAGHRAIDRRRLSEVATYLQDIDDLMHRGIECGALVDPWNIIGFGANFSLFPALENTVHDYRVDDLIQIVEQILDLCSRAWAEAAAIDDADFERVFSTHLAKVADWWDSFGASSVSGVQPLEAKEIEISTNLVAGALNAWHKAGAAAGDVAFWRMFVDQFDTSKAFQLVIEALLDKGDLVASMALMMQWLNQVELTPLEEGDAAFHPLALRWLRMAELRAQQTEGDDGWKLVARFFQLLEANAQEYWFAPNFEPGRHPSHRDDELYLDEDDDEDEYSEDEEDDFDNEYFDEEEEDEDEFEVLDNLFTDEESTYHDSSDDGQEGSLYDPFDDSTSELEDEAHRLRQRLAFLNALARLWKQTAIAWNATDDPRRQELFDSWQREAASRYAQLVQLLEQVHRYRIPLPENSHESMVEFDRHRMMQEALTEQIITTCVEMSDAGRLLCAAAGLTLPAENSPIAHTIEILRAVLRGEPAGVQQHWEAFTESLAREELLYVPLSRGGVPVRIVKARALHQLIHDLLGWLPRLGLVRETCQLLDVSQRMEIEHPVGFGAVTEYDHLFENGYQALVRCVVASADSWDEANGEAGSPRRSDNLLVDALQDLTESQLERWLHHSLTVRLSVVEKLSDPTDWQSFVQFVTRYGADLFTQRFLSLGNLRSILHQGVEVWLDQQLAEPEEDAPLLFNDIGHGITRIEAIDQLTLVIEAVVENYREYRDYNTTTTQSDHGELLYYFVDFLRLRASYDRAAWNMKPVFLAHEILIRHGRDMAAEMWRDAIAERTRQRADRYLTSFAKLCQEYGMQLPTIAERLGERFVRPLAVDCLRALAAPAIEAADGEQENGAFETLEREIEQLMAEPCGAGLDVPDWIAALEEEVTTIRRCRRHHQPEDGLLQRINQIALDWEQLQSQLEDDSTSSPQ
jgi:hypothetical protein